MRKFKEDEILILLGAGASCDAGILNSAQIINDIQNQIESNPEWKEFDELYRYIKSVYYQKEIFKSISEYNVNFNIESLVGLLNIIISISKRELDIYPFVGSWEKDLQPFISEQKSKNLATKFRERIIKSLRSDWLMPNNWIENSNYFKKMIDLKKEYDGSPLKIFTLNYDKCVEQNLKDEKLEIGFDEYDKWNSKRYDYNNTQSDYFLYKLHGSINWKKRKEEQLTQFSGDISPEDLAIIFGISNKLQSYDPYLFYFYEFRVHCIKAELVICSGYSFLDGHINDVLKLGFAGNTNKRLIVNVFDSKKGEDDIKVEISEKTLIDKSQIEIFNKKAKDFYNDDLKLEKFSSLFPEDIENLPEGI